MPHSSPAGAVSRDVLHKWHSAVLSAALFISPCIGSRDCFAPGGAMRPGQENSPADPAESAIELRAPGAPRSPSSARIGNCRQLSQNVWNRGAWSALSPRSPSEPTRDLHRPPSCCTIECTGAIHWRPGRPSRTPAASYSADPDRGVGHRGGSRRYGQPAGCAALPSGQRSVVQ